MHLNSKEHTLLRDLNQDIKRDVFTVVKIGKKQGVAFRRCGLPAGSGKPPALSDILQSEGLGSTRRDFLGRSSVGRWCSWSQFDESDSHGL